MTSLSPLPRLLTPRWRATGAHAARLVVATALALLSGCGGSKSEPGLRVEPSPIDFGTLPVGQQAVRRVRVTNTTAAQLLVTEVKASCKCIEVDGRFQRSLSPGDSTTIDVRLKATSDGPKGRLEGKKLWVHSDSDEAPVVEVAVHGLIEERVTLSPSHLAIGPEDAAGRGRPRRLRVLAAAGYTARIERVVLSHPDWFDAVQGQGPDGPELTLTVKPDPARRGPIAATVKLLVATAGGSAPPLSSELTADIQGAW